MIMAIVALGWIGVCISLLVLVIKNQIDINRYRKHNKDWYRKHTDEWNNPHGGQRENDS